MKKQHLDFAVIGAQKCATSWMFYCLQDHPEICMPTKKRESSYIGGPMFKENGPDWFFDRFACGEHTVMGDISVDYLYDSQSAKELQKYSQSPKIIVSLRNPVERLVSSYYWLCRSSLLPNLKIDEWVERLPASSMDWEEELGQTASQVILRGFYERQLRIFLQTFPADHFLILLYEDIQSNPLESIQRVYDFLGVDSQFSPKNLNSRPKKNSHNSFLLYIERTFRSRLTSHVVNFAHQQLSRFNKRTAPISKKSVKKLEGIFAEQVQRLLNLLEEIPDSNRPSVAAIKSQWNISADD